MVCTYQQTAARTAAEEEVGPGHEGSVPPARGSRTEGGESARRRRLQCSINVGGCRANPPRKMMDREDDDEDDDHHGWSLPPALPSAEPRPCADD